MSDGTTGSLSVVVAKTDQQPSVLIGDACAESSGVTRGVQMRSTSPSVAAQRASWRSVFLWHEREDSGGVNTVWARLDDELIDHQKIFLAGELIGKNGPAVALGFYSVGLMWANKHLTDGHLPLAVIKNFRHVDNPTSIADALVKAGLWDKNGSGFVIHDYKDYNPTAAQVKKRRADRHQNRGSGRA